MEQQQLVFNASQPSNPMRPRRAHEELKAERRERKRRKQAIRKDKELSRERRLERRRRRELARTYIKQRSCSSEAQNGSWRTCLCCYRVLPISRIVDKRFNICIDCK
ncbi:MAG: hypothetical protein ACFFCW_22915 [Candidatus Hodarchaeota archaeon]